MPKYIIYKDTVFGRKYLTRFIDGKPYSSDKKELAEVTENRDLAEFVAYQAKKYTGQLWWVQEVEDGK